MPGRWAEPSAPQTPPSWGLGGWDPGGGYGNKAKAKEGLPCCPKQAGPRDEKPPRLVGVGQTQSCQQLDDEKIQLSR